MNQIKTPPASPAFEDPRTRSGFRAKYYPKANRREAPAVNTTGRNDRVILEFLAVYYELNCQYDALLQARKKPKSPERTRTEAAHLQVIEQILIARDRLEDRYAPCGVIAEPIVEKGFTVDITFSFGNVDARGRPRSGSLTISTYIPIPLPPGTRLSDLPLKIEGPGFPAQRPP
jgi:hypothetical protein